MNQFANALGKSFLENKDMVRTRSFSMGGHTFKVKVPLTVEFESMQKRIAEVDDSKVEKYYQELTADLEKYKGNTDSTIKCEWQDNDVILDGRSMREAAKNKVQMQARITEMFKLLVPEEKGFDMATITYEMVEELFPFPVQVQVIEKIGEVISPAYTETKGK